VTLSVFQTDKFIVWKFLIDQPFGPVVYLVYGYIVSKSQAWDDFGLPWPLV
jgi:hypothetical protein